MEVLNEGNIMEPTSLSVKAGSLNALPTHAQDKELELLQINWNRTRSKSLAIPPKALLQANASNVEELRLQNLKLEHALEVGRDKMNAAFQEKEMAANEKKKLEQELEDLTQSLFEEANNMVEVERRRNFELEKRQYELESTLDSLKEELKALKQKVYDQTVTDASKKPVLFTWPGKAGKPHSVKGNQVSEGRVTIEDIDPIELEEVSEFLSLLGSEGLQTCAFLLRVQDEDVLPCMHLHGTRSSQLLEAIVSNSLIVEALPNRREVMAKCQACRRPQQCKHRFRIVGDGTDEADWKYVGVSCHRRLMAVGDFFTYLRYLEQGILTPNTMEVYRKCVELRQAMSHARLGITTCQLNE
eukprot:Colp12_sorted_trinity150504_noHs@13976